MDNADSGSRLFFGVTLNLVFAVVTLTLLGVAF